MYLAHAPERAFTLCDQPGLVKVDVHQRHVDSHVAVVNGGAAEIVARHGMIECCGGEEAEETSVGFCAAVGGGIYPLPGR